MKRQYFLSSKRSFDLNIGLHVVVSDSVVAFVELAELFEEFVRVTRNGTTKKKTGLLFVSATQYLSCSLQKEYKRQHTCGQTGPK